jgi:hypothetical protein
MQDWMADPRTRDESPEPRYRARVVEGVALQPSGLHHLEAGEPALLPWDDVRLAVAAEIGEPEGVRTIVFDVIADTGDGWLAHRLDAEPGSEAMLQARELAEWLAPEVCGPSLKSLAADGIPSRWYPDLASFEDDTLERLGGA